MMANNIQGYEKIVDTETTDCFEELERVRTFVEGDSLWELYDEHDGAEVCMSDYQNSSVKVLRGIVEINADAKELANFVWNLRVEDWQKIDPMITGLEDFDESENYRIRSEIIELPWPLWPRETAYGMQRIKEEGGKHWIIQRNIESHHVPLQQDKYVRAHLGIGAFLLEDLGNSQSLLTRVLQCDVNGSLPVMVSNMFMGKMSGQLKWIRDAIHEKQRQVQ